jgi:hypothetical protein
MRRSGTEWHPRQLFVAKQVCGNFITSRAAIYQGPEHPNETAFGRDVRAHDEQKKSVEGLSGAYRVTTRIGLLRSPIATVVYRTLASKSFKTGDPNTSSVLNLFVATIVKSFSQ